MSKLLALSALVAALPLAGCGGDTTISTPADMAMQIFKVQSGAYNVSNIMKVSDGCMMGLEMAGVFTSIQVTNDGNGNLSLGTQCMTTGNPPTCNPAVFSNGQGMFTDSYHATVMATTMVTADSGGVCTYNRTRTSMVTVTANNTLNIDFTNADSNIATGCSAPPANPSTCTSHYTYTASM